jgi:hypothetical protein
MIFFPAARFLTGPRPPLEAAALFLAAVIRPPRDFFAIRIVSFILAVDWFADLAKQPSSRELRRADSGLIISP